MGQASSRGERHRLAQQLRADGKTWAEIGGILRGRLSVSARAAMRLAHGWTQQQAAEEWGLRWPDRPKDKKWFSYQERWPNGGRPPSLGDLDKLAQLYQCAVTDLLTDLDYGDLDRATKDAAEPASDTPTTPSWTSHRALQDADGIDARRRVGTVEVLDDLAQMATWSSPGAELATTTSADIAAMGAISAAFQVADRKLGGGALYEPVARYLRDEVASRLLAAIGGAAEAESFAAAASLTEAAGWMAHDAGSDQHAREHLGRAFRLASAASNAALIGNVCASMSHLAGQLDRPDDAVRLAEIGLGHTRESDGVARLIARLHAMRARGLAYQGAERDCHAALEAAERALADGDHYVAEWVTPFDAGSLSSEMAMCHRSLGNLTEAERNAIHAIELRPGDRRRSRALAQLTLAEVLVDQNRIEEAATTGQEVCTTAETLRSTQVLRRLDDLGATLAAHSSLSIVASFLASLAAVHDQPHSVEHREDSWPA